MTRLLWLLPLLLLAGESDAQTCVTVSECSAAIDALRRETRLEFDQRSEAVSTAQMNMEKRLEGMNEFRAQLRDQAGTFVTREKYEAQIEEIRARLDDADRGRAMILGVVAAVQVLFGIGFALYLKRSPIRAPSRESDVGRPAVKAPES